MSRYILSERTYNTLVGRGYRLVCKICECNLEIGQEVESKHSGYWRWECEDCGWNTKKKPKERKRIGKRWVLKCPICSGTVFCIGRKFYCASCYDKSFRNGNGDNDEDIA